MELNLCLDWTAFVEEATRRRKEQRLSQEKLVILAGVSKPTIDRFEQRHTNLKLESVLKILGV